QGGGQGQGGGGPGPDPGAEPQPEPEPDLPVAPAELVVPGELKLKAGAYTGSFTVANAGGAPLDWKAWPDPGVAVSVEEGTLAGGEQVLVSFTIDPAQLPSGSFQRRIMVDAPDVGARDLWISGTKPIDAIAWCTPGTC
ncbi:MAG: hypothetical protein ACLGIO_09785, partial [Acidimicrobiia bacterium]